MLFGSKYKTKPAVDPGSPKGEGANSRCGCANLLFLQNICQKLHENGKIWTGRGVCVEEGGGVLPMQAGVAC